MKKRICLISAVFMTALLLSASSEEAHGQEFSSFDAKDFVRQHPLTRRFDPATRRFTETPGAYMDMVELEDHIRKIENDIVKLKQNQQKRLQQALTLPAADSEAFWAEQTAERLRLEALEQQRREYLERLRVGGKTEDVAIIPQIKALAASLSAALPREGMVLNHLPEPVLSDEPKRPLLPQANSPLQNFFWTGNPQALTLLIEHRYRLLALFPRFRRPILYQVGEH